MSYFPDQANPWDSDPFAGPQSDGTTVYPVLMPQPTDAGGGAPGAYSQSILDVFKFGVGVWQQDRRTDQLLEYKRYEATQAGLAQQGQAALQQAMARQGSNTTMLLVIGAVAIALVMSKKG